MKLILFIMMTTSFVFSSNLSSLYKQYEKQEYEKACDYGRKYLFKNANINNEKYLTLYGLSCLETDKIERISIPMIHLKSNKNSRANASYFSTILLQKYLLFQALIDKKSIKDLHLPTTTFILSKVFNLFVEEKFTLKNGVYKLEDKSKENIRYQLYIEESKKDKKYMIIDIYKDDKFSHRYRYE
jgi:hypothetical protein